MYTSEWASKWWTDGLVLGFCINCKKILNKYSLLSTINCNCSSSIWNILFQLWLKGDCLSALCSWKNVDGVAMSVAIFGYEIWKATLWLCKVWGSKWKKLLCTFKILHIIKMSANSEETKNWNILFFIKFDRKNIIPISL